MEIVSIKNSRRAHVIPAKSRLEAVRQAPCGIRHADVAATLPPGVELAHDGLVVPQAG